MAIFNPGFLGLVFLKNESTYPCVQMHKDHWSKFPEIFGGEFNEDDHLIGFSVAMSGNILDEQIDRAQEMGAVFGRDFFATSSVEGVISDKPEWLLVETTNGEIRYSMTEA